MKIESIAKLCHTLNRAYCETLGDLSQPAWEDAPAWQKESAIDGVQAVAQGVVVTPEGSHRGWLDKKEADGWKYGAMKDPDKKEHPCMVPFDDLPESQQRKDKLFFAVVKVCL